MGVGCSHKSGLLHRCFPPNSQKRKAALQASVTACSFTKTNKPLGPKPTAIPASTKPDRDHENSPAPHQFCKDAGGWLGSHGPLYKSRVGRGWVTLGRTRVTVQSPGHARASVISLSLPSFLFSFLPSFPPCFIIPFLSLFPSSFL